MDPLLILRALFEILVLWVIFYQLYRAFKDSRAAAILGGLVILVLSSIFLLSVLHASVLQCIVSAIIGPGTLLVVLFQNEARTALAKLGTNPYLRAFFRKNDQNRDFIADLCSAVFSLSSRRHGALIAICRQHKLSEYVKTGIPMDAVCTKELLCTIFWPKTALHDGAVIIDNQRVLCAGAILPVSDKELKDTSLGLRHRAAIGLGEKSDAVIIVVSEETGSVSLVIGKSFQRDLTQNYLYTRLHELLYGIQGIPEKKAGGDPHS